MTRQTPPAAPAAAAEDEWQRLLADAPPAGAGDAAEARAVLAAMRAESDALTPSTATRQAVWQRIETALAAPAREVPPPAWWKRRAFWSTFALGGLVAALVAGIALRQQAPQQVDFDWVASRGIAWHLPIADFAAPTPLLIHELQALGVAVDWQRGTNEIRLSAQIPAPPPAGLADWQTRWGVVAAPGQPLSLILVRPGAAP